MATNRKALMEILQKKYPNMWMKLSEEFGPDYKGGIWTGEGSVNSKGKPLFDYWAGEPGHIFGVVVSLHHLLEKHGWYSECYDAGTYFFYEN